MELEDGTSNRLFTNKTAKNVYTQIYGKSREILTFVGIIDHRRNDEAERKAAGSKPSKSTKWWQAVVEWKIGTFTWMPKRNVKEVKAAERAEYVVKNYINQEPVLLWWAPYALKKQKIIIAKTKTKFWKATHKHGVKLPKTAKEALWINYMTGTDYWRKKINKEMKNAKVLYKDVEGYMPKEVRIS